MYTLDKTNRTYKIDEEELKQKLHLPESEIIVSIEKVDFSISLWNIETFEYFKKEK